MQRLILCLTATALAVVIALPQSALAAGCAMTTSAATQTFSTGGRTFYTVALGCDAGKICPFAEFVYQETNGIPGLQRHDVQHDDTCGDPLSGDLQNW